MKVERMNNKKFKTNEIAIFLTVPLKRETITKNALLPAVLRRGTMNYPTQLEIGKQLEEMYGAFFNCGIDKTGNYCVLKFYIETICDKYTSYEEKLVDKAMELIKDIIYNPLIEDEGFRAKYVDQEKENLRKKIESKKDNKAVYSMNRCIEEMFKNDPYGIYQYGYVEDLENIDEKNLYEYYKKMIKKCDVQIIINGEDAKIAEIPEEIKQNNNTIQINESVKVESKLKTVREKAEVTQGKLIIGMKTPNENRFAVSMYNAILGGGANSKLFQNVREKASLAYSAGSKYVRRKDTILIATGIELQNFDKAINIIDKQIDDMRVGNITDDEFEKAKQLVISSLNLVKESQEDMISFKFEQKLFEENLEIDDYIKSIKKVTKQEVIDVAQNISMNTIYYLEK